MVPDVCGVMASAYQTSMEEKVSVQLLVCWLATGWRSLETEFQSTGPAK